MLETRRLVAEFDTPEALRNGLRVFMAENSAEAYILYRELDYFEQLGALERHDARRRPLTAGTPWSQRRAVRR
jgi:hypothetical protein